MPEAERERERERASSGTWKGRSRQRYDLRDVWRALVVWQNSLARLQFLKHDLIAQVNMDKQEKLLTEQAETVFADLLESAILDVASEAHRAAHLGMDPKLSIDEEGEYQLSVQARISVGDSYISGSKKSKHGVDIFGQTLPAIATEVFECMNCNRKIMAGRFAPHLEKCMGKERRSRPKTTSTTKTEPQRKTEMYEKGDGMTASSASTKLEVPNFTELRKNGDVNAEANNKVSKKISKHLKKGASNRPSRISGRQSL